MLTIKNFTLVLFLIGCLTACDQTEYNLTPSVAGYPMRVGMKWTYDRQVIIKEFESPSSNRIVTVDTINSELYVWVEKDTVLNKKTVKVFKSKDGYMNVTAARYMLSDTVGLKTIAYRDLGRDIIARGLYLKSNAAKTAFDDTIRYESIPALDLKLPLMTDSSWIYKYPTKADPLQIDKMVTSQQTLTLTGMKINCYQLEWLYSRDSRYMGYKTTEWLSGKGLMKRIRTCDRVTFTDENDNPLYEGQYSETLTLKSFRYK